MTTSQIKCVFVGDASVGKTSIINRIIKGTFNEHYLATSGGQFQNYIPKNQEGEQEQCVYQLWDTAGQEAYQTVVQLFFRNAAIAFLVFDLTSESSFNNLRSWAQRVIDNASPECILVIIGNKCDLDEQRVINDTQITELANSLQTGFTFQVSAKTGQNIDLIFETVKEHKNSILSNKISDTELSILKTTTEGETNKQKGWFSWLSCSLI